MPSPAAERRNDGRRPPPPTLAVPSPTQASPRRLAPRRAPPARRSPGRRPRGPLPQPRHRAAARPGRTSPGDDPRHIDWAVTARTGDPHVRDTIADHELELWLVLDRSASIAFGTGRSTKHELAWAAGGSVRAARRTRRKPGRGAAHRRRPPPTASRPDRAGARGERPRGGGRSTARWRASAISAPRSTGLRRTARRRGMVVIVSDFLDAPTWERPLRALAQRHDVIAVEISDPRERSLPDVGLLAVVDPETGRRRLLDTGNAETSPTLRRACGTTASSSSRHGSPRAAPITSSSAPSATGSSTWSASCRDADRAELAAVARA